jgi:hypothetical protein
MPIIRLNLTLEEAGSLLELLTVLVADNELLLYRLEFNQQKMHDFKSMQQTLIETLNTF